MPIGVLLLLVRFVAARPEYAVTAGAQSAPRSSPPTAKVLDISGRVVDIVGVTRGIEGALKDLGAKVTDREIRIELSADVLFDFDKDDLRPDAFESLRKVGQILKEYANAQVAIEGHTDSKGTHAYNQKLSDDRALSVKSWLVSNAGNDARLITTRGWAETRPVAPNTKPDQSDDPAGRQKNRRVEITIHKQ